MYAFFKMISQPLKEQLTPENAVRFREAFERETQRLKSYEQQLIKYEQDLLKRAKELEEQKKIFALQQQAFQHRVILVFYPNINLLCTEAQHISFCALT
jgi:hypothetical protein